MNLRHRLIRQLAPTLFGALLLTSSVHGQEPAARAGGVAIEFGAEPVPGEKSARERAKDYLTEKSLREGWNPDKKLWIGIGSATIAQLPGTDEWDVARYVAFMQACADAKQKAAERMGVATRTAMESASKTGTDLNAAKKQAFQDANAEGARQLGVVDKVAAIIDAEVDKEYKARVPAATAEPTDAEKAARTADAEKRRQELTKDLLKDARFQSVVEAVSKEEVGAMQCFRTFEEIPPGKKGSIAVIMACSEASLELAAALMGQRSETPSGGPGTSRENLQDWVNKLDEKTLLFTLGCQVRQNDKGEVVLVAFGQSTPTVDEEDLIDDARSGAAIAALEQARNFVGEMIETRGMLSRDQQLKMYRDGGMGAVETEARTRKEQARQFKAQGDSLVFSGMDDVREWDERHPLSKVPTFGSVRIFSMSGAQAAQQMKQAMEAVGGSKGGQGVAANPPSPAGKPPRAPSDLKCTVEGQETRLTWKDNSDNEQGFVIEQSKDEQDWTTNKTVSANQVEATLVSCQPGCWYRVRATNAFGRSGPTRATKCDGSGTGEPHGGSSGKGAEPQIP